jgi:hypothetical protein
MKTGMETLISQIEAMQRGSTVRGGYETAPASERLTTRHAFTPSLSAKNLASPTYSAVPAVTKGRPTPPETPR